jgi:uncharacterized protein YkwD
MPGKIWLIVATLLISTVVMSLASVAHGGSAHYRFRRSERCFMEKINMRRRHHGLRVLEWDKQLGYVARRHAQTLAYYQGVWHDNEIGHHVTHWRSLGQNTGAGHRCRELFHAFWRSSVHRENILGPYDFVGVGTSWGHHRMYVQQIFESRYNPGNVYSYP